MPYHFQLSYHPILHFLLVTLLFPLPLDTAGLGQHDSWNHFLAAPAIAAVASISALHPPPRAGPMKTGHMTRYMEWGCREVGNGI